MFPGCGGAATCHGPHTPLTPTNVQCHVAEYEKTFALVDVVVASEQSLLLGISDSNTVVVCKCLDREMWFLRRSRSKAVAVGKY